MEAVFAEWRRARSPTAGGLVWLYRDLAPGIGWGVVDAAGRPKSPWYALKRAFRSIQVTLSDEGLNGLKLHVHNEMAAPLHATLRLAFSDPEGRTVAQAERAITLDPRATAAWSSATLLGRFFDATGSYRFGPAAHSLAHASLSDPSGGLLAESFHFPQGRDPEPRPIGLAAEIEDGQAGPVLRVTARRHALCVRIETEDDARPADDGFHLAPGAQRRIAFVGARHPHGTVKALNTNEIVRF